MYDRILVPIDGSEPAQRGLREAVEAGRCLGARLILMHIVDNLPLQREMSTAATFEHSLDLLRKRGYEVLARARETAQAAGVETESLLREIQHETVADAILEQVRLSDCKLIVMGTHGRRGMKRLAMGSDAELVLRASPVPVLLVRREDPPN